MKFGKLFFIPFVVFGLLSCATNYQETSFTGGFSETQLDVNVFKVNFRGNALIKREKAEDFAMLRAAELTIENGFSYFSVLDSENLIVTSTYTTPTSASTTLNGNCVFRRT